MPNRKIPEVEVCFQKISTMLAVINFSYPCYMLCFCVHAARRSQVIFVFTYTAIS